MERKTIHEAKFAVPKTSFADNWMRLWSTTIRHGAPSQKATNKPENIKQ
jgi:hypothetical protein